MDKYEYNVKLEQIKKLIKKKDYATAARIADTIDWYKVKNNQTIIMIADVYEASGRYDQSKENLKLAYDRSGLGRQIAYKLVKICIKCGELEEAEDFYDDFVSAAPKDISKYILQYELAKAKGDPIDKQISILEQYLEEDMDDKWAFELAKLYHKSGQRDKCIRQCDTVMLWFSDGKYVERAMDLKMIYTPLNKSQQERYEARWREKTGQTGFEAEEIRVKEVDVSNKYNTQNIQAALKESMDELYSEEKKESGKRENIFRPTMPSPEYEETHEQYEYSEEALYEEAEETAAGADDYLYRMNQNPQYDEASFDFAQESEQHIDDLGDTKVFVTTRSKKNLGDTKVFAPIRQAVPERINFEETANETENEAYILEEKTIKNTSGLFYEEESEENLKEIWGNPEGIVENSEEEFIEEEEEQELPEEELQEEFIEEEQEFPIEELQEEFIEEEQEFPIEELQEEFIEEEEEQKLLEEEQEEEFTEEQEFPEEELEEEFIEEEEEQELPEEELEEEFIEEEEEQELPEEELEEELEEDPDVLSDKELEELLEKDILSGETEKEEFEEQQAEEENEEIIQNTEEAFELEALPEEIQKGLEDFIVGDDAEVLEVEPESVEIKEPEISEEVSEIDEAAVSKEPEVNQEEDFEEVFSVEDFFNSADGYCASEKPTENKKESEISSEESVFQEEPEKPELEDGYQEPMQVSADESEYEYQPEEELGDPEEYENQYQELRESSIIESLYGYQPEEELGDPEEYENQYQELKETSIIEPQYESSYQEYQPDTENSEDFEEYENEYQEYQPEVEKVKEEYEYQPEEKLETEEYKYQPESEPEKCKHQPEPKEEYEYQPEPEEYEYQPESEPEEYEYQPESEPEEYEYQPESEPEEYEYQSESEPEEYEYQPQSEELEAPEESVVEQPAEYELPNDSNENGGDEDEDENEVLTHDEIKGIIKDFIGKYSGIQGLDKQMLKTLQNIIVDDSCNIIIMGDAKSGKTSLGLDIIKVVNKIKRNNNRRIAKISADKLIGKELSIYFTRLRGSDIYIENISLMDDDTVTELLEAMNKDIDNRIVVIEDEKANAERFLNKHEEVRDYFANQIVVKQNKIKDWVEVAREYAEEQGYKIDEMGLLALHAKIDQLYAITLVIQKNHVDAVIDSAIKKAGKGSLIKKIFGKKKEKILTEEHFSL